jgi:HK97 family phage major capsid protein
LAVFARSGDESELGNYKAAWTTGSDDSAGYLDPPATSDSINKKLFESNPIMGLARVIDVGPGSSWQEPIDTSDADASWTGKTESRTETSAETIGLTDIPLDESTALVKLTQRILDDSRFDLGKYVEDKLTDRFARLEDAAFCGGDGVKKPKGFLTYSTSSAGDSTRASQTYQYTPSASAVALTPDAVISTLYSLRVPYRSSAGVSWLANSDTCRQLRLMKDGSGQYLWVPGFGGSSDRLCGVPMTIDENMPSVGANALPLAIACWPKAYTIIQRRGLKFLRDPFSAKPYVLIYAIRRVGGQSSGDFDALKFCKVATS